MKNYLDIQGVDVLWNSVKDEIEKQSQENNVQIIKIVIKEDQYNIDETTGVGSGQLLEDDLTELQNALTENKIFLLQVEFPNNTIIFEAVTKQNDGSILCLHSIITDNPDNPQKSLSGYYKLLINTQDNTFTLSTVLNKADDELYTYAVSLSENDFSLNEEDQTYVLNSDVLEKLNKYIKENRVLAFKLNWSLFNNSDTSLNTYYIDSTANTISLRSIDLINNVISKSEIVIELLTGKTVISTSSVDTSKFAEKENVYTKEEIDEYVNKFEPIILNLNDNPDVIDENTLIKIRERIDNNLQLFFIAIASGDIAAQNSYYVDVSNSTIQINLDYYGAYDVQDHSTYIRYKLFLNYNSGEYTFEGMPLSEIDTIFITENSDGTIDDRTKQILRNATEVGNLNFVIMYKNGLYHVVSIVESGVFAQTIAMLDENSIICASLTVNYDSGTITTDSHVINITDKINNALRNYYNKTEIDSKVSEINNNITENTNLINTKYNELNTKIDSTKSALEQTINSNDQKYTQQINKLNSYFTNDAANKALADASGNVITTTYATKEELNNFITTTAPSTYVAIENFKANYLDANNVAYKSDFNNYYTSTKVDELLNKLSEGLTTVVDTLPENPQAGIIYLLTTDDENNYEKWVWENNEWISLGSTIIDLTGYVTGTNLTNNQIILGSDNSAVKTSGKSISTLINNDDNEVPTSKAVKTELDKKQNTLVSGTNIKTINGESILGSGDISTIQDLSDYANKTTENTYTQVQHFDSINGISLGTENINQEWVENVNTQTDKVPNMETSIENLTVSVSNLGIELDSKVDKVEGKELSSNDFTDDLKTKLENIPNDLNEQISNFAKLNENNEFEQTQTVPELDIKKSNTEIIKLTYDSLKELENQASQIHNKQDVLVSGTNIKTIDNQSVLGSGNLSISDKNTVVIDLGTITNDGTITSENLTKINDNISAKTLIFKIVYDSISLTSSSYAKVQDNILITFVQEMDPIVTVYTLLIDNTGNTAVSTRNLQLQLISGDNIKTINNQTLLGSGNIDLQNKIPVVTISLTNGTLSDEDYKILENNDIIQFNDADGVGHFIGAKQTIFTPEDKSLYAMCFAVVMPTFDDIYENPSIYTINVANDKTFKVATESIYSGITISDDNICLSNANGHALSSHNISKEELKEFSGINDLENNKVSKIGIANKVYATDNAGTDTNISYSTSASSWSIAQRTETNQLKAADPVSSDDLTTKNYVDTNFTTKTELAALIGDAPENLDSLKEIADYLKNHENETGEIISDIAGKQDKTDNTLTTTEKTITGAINELNLNKQNILTLEQLNAVNSGITPEIVEKINNNQLEYLPLTGGTVNGQVTIDESSDEFQENIESIAYKVRFKTGSNQIGAVSFGKESSNNGAMVKFEQVEGTTRLQFRASNTPGAMVWRQPEASSQLYLDVDSINFRLKGNGEVKGFRLNQDYFRPNNNNVGSLGDSTHNFLALYATTVYENGSSLAEKYALKSETPTEISITDNKLSLYSGSSAIGNGIALTELQAAMNIPENIEGVMDKFNEYLPLAGGTLTGDLTATAVLFKSTTADSNATAKITAGNIGSNITFTLPTSSGTLTTSEAVNTLLEAKQDTLVSGTNIKTINGASILGNGDLLVSTSDNNFTDDYKSELDNLASNYISTEKFNEVFTDGSANKAIADKNGNDITTTYSLATHNHDSVYWKRTETVNDSKNSSRANFLRVEDTRSENLSPLEYRTKIKAELGTAPGIMSELKSASTINLADVGGYVNLITIINRNDSSGGNAIQIARKDDQQFVRYEQSSTEWTEWQFSAVSENSIVETVIDNMFESQIKWGNTDLSNSISPADAAISNLHSANRFAFADPAGISVEYTTDGGTTWLDYGAGDSSKISLVSGISTALYIGKLSSTDSRTATPNDQLRVTFDSSTMNVYTMMKKLLLNVSTSGASGCKVKVEYSTFADPDTFIEYKTSSVSGWSGWNSINISGYFGDYTEQGSTHYRKIRLTFTITSVSNSNGAFTLLDVYCVGITYWQTPSRMAREGHLYKYDYLQNATFPAEVAANSFKTSGQLTAATISVGNIAITGGTSSSGLKTINNASLFGSGNIDLNTQYYTKTEIDDKIDAIESSGSDGFDYETITV